MPESLLGNFQIFGPGSVGFRGRSLLYLDCGRDHRGLIVRSVRYNLRVRASIAKHRSAAERAMTKIAQSGHLTVVAPPGARGRPVLRSDFPRQDVNSKTVGAIVFVCVFGGALLGLFLGPVLPKEHLSSETTTVVRLAMAMISLMSAVVVGLLIASAKGSFDLRDAEYRHSCANIILLDRAMAHYGPETKVGRDLLRQFAENRLRAVWPEDCRQRAHIECAPMEVDREAMQEVRKHDTVAISGHPRVLAHHHIHQLRPFRAP